jgi:hypothetical protein
VEMGIFLICLLPLSPNCKPNEVLSIAAPARKVQSRNHPTAELLKARTVIVCSVKTC